MPGSVAGILLEFAYGSISCKSHHEETTDAKSHWSPPVPEEVDEFVEIGVESVAQTAALTSKPIQLAPQRTRGDSPRPSVEETDRLSQDNFGREGILTFGSGPIAKKGSDNRIEGMSKRVVKSGYKGVTSEYL